MLSEESLVLIAVLVACGLVSLGVLEMVWPTRPRHPERRRPGAEAWRQARARVAMPAPAPWPMPQRAVSTPRLAARASERRPPRGTIAAAPLDESAASIVDATARPDDLPEASVVAAAPADELAVAIVSASALADESPVAMVAVPAPPADEAVVPAGSASPDDEPAIAVVSATAPVEEPTIAMVPAPPPVNEPAIAMVPAPLPIEEPAIDAVSAASSDETPPLESDSPPPLRIVPPTEEREIVRRPRVARLRPLPRPAPRPLRAEISEEPAGPRAAPPVETPASLTPEVSVVERCFTLLEARRFAEVVTLAEATLRSQRSGGMSAPSPVQAQETARLWGVVGLAKQGVDDFDGARFALEEAIAVAPRTERPTWERYLASLALTVGRQSLGGDEAEPPRPARVDSLRSAIDWLERGLVASPDDAGLREALGAAREALWPTYEAIVKAQVQRGEFGEARRILDEVVGDPDCPPDRRDAFRKLLGSAIGSEVGHATAEALRHLQRDREEDAGAALARAETIMGAIAPDALSAKRRQELERRLWWGYMKLGGNRVEAKAREAAMDPLFRALSFAESGSEQQDATRSMLTRAIGELVDERGEEIGRLIETGDVAAASGESDKLWSLIRGAVDRGLSEDDLLAPFDKVLAFYRRIGGKRA